MEITFKDEAEKKEFQNNIVDSITSLDIHSKEFNVSKAFLKSLYDQLKQ